MSSHEKPSEAENRSMVGYNPPLADEAIPSRRKRVFVSNCPARKKPMTPLTRNALAFRLRLARFHLSQDRFPRSKPLDKREQLSVKVLGQSRFRLVRREHSFFECPDSEIHDEYLLSCELITASFSVYGSPNTGTR